MTDDRTQQQLSGPTVSAATVRGFPAIPGYEVLREIGRGGMGVVYEARQSKLDRVVALKLMLGDDALNKARFLAEGQVIAAVKHPQVVEVYDFGECDAGPYIAMEYLTGGSLADRIKAGTAFAPKDAAELLAKIAGGVGAAHDLGIVHRDLKPGNVLLDANGNPKVTDFGLAKRSTSELTQTQDAAGTPAYMAPEQAKAMKFVGPPADVWSLGVMLYEALTARRPFAAETDLELLITIQNSDPPTLRTVSKGIPHDLETVCLKCLEKEPDRRYASAKELATDLEAWCEGKPISARRATRTERALLWVRRKPTVAAAWALGLLVVVLGGFAATTTNLWWKAVHEKSVSDKLRENAENDKTRAETAEGEAMKAKSDVANEREQVAYARNVYMAHAEYFNGDFSRSKLFLDECPEKLRGWEWNYVNRICRSGWTHIGNRNESLIAINRNNHQVITSDGENGKLTAWSIHDGKKLYDIQEEIADEPPLYRNTRYSNDGKRIIWTSDGNNANVYDSLDGKQIHCLQGHTKSIRCFETSLDGSMLATGSDDQSAIIWNLSTGEKIITLANHAQSVEQVAFSKKNDRLFTRSANVWNVWDVKTGARIGKAIATSAIADTHIREDGTSMTIVGGRRTIRKWDATNGKMLFSTSEFDTRIRNVQQTADGKWIIGSGETNECIVWSGANGELVNRLDQGASEVKNVTISDDSLKMATENRDGTVYLWNVSSGELICKLNDPKFEYREVVGFSRNSKRIAVYQYNDEPKDNVLSIYNANSGSVSCAISMPNTSSGQIAGFCSEGNGFITNGHGMSIRCWDTNTGKLAYSIPVVNDDPFAIMTSDEQKCVVRNREDTDVYDARDGKKLYSIAGQSIINSPGDGNILFTRGTDEKIHVWNADMGKKICTLTNSQEIRLSSLSSDNTLIVTEKSTVDGTICNVYNLSTGDIVTNITITGDPRTYFTTDFPVR